MTPSQRAFSGDLSRRRFLRRVGAASAGLLLAPALTGRTARGEAAAPRASGTVYSFVNNTGGKFADDQCFWSLDGGKQWHSFAREPTVSCPAGNGRLYFRLGAAPKNFDDRESYWDFIEYAYGPGGWNGNTTQVDAFCIPITLELAGADGKARKVGITESRAALFAAFRKNAPEAFRDCVRGDYWIVSPCRAGFRGNGPAARYFDDYLSEVWDAYATGKKTPGGWTGKVTGGALTFTPPVGAAGGGKPVSCPRKPTTQEAFLGAGVLSANPVFCAAINRHVLADPADWGNPAKFYQAEPCNWYSRFFHEHAIDHKAYGFCYDDVSEQAAFFSGKGDILTVTLNWDLEKAADA